MEVKTKTTKEDVENHSQLVREKAPEDIDLYVSESTDRLLTVSMKDLLNNRRGKKRCNHG